MRKELCLTGLSCGMLLNRPGCAEETISLRPPAVPLVAHDPYFSIWSQADRLTDCHTTHWTGKPQPLNSVIRIDGEAFRIMGVEPAGAPALPQTEVQVLPTRTIYRFENSSVKLILTFLTPALPSDLDVLSRPVTYVAWEVVSGDGKPHAVQIDFGCSGLLAVDMPQQEVLWDRPPVEGLVVTRVGAKQQNVLGRRGDDLRIDWGYAYLAAPAEPRVQIAGDGVVRFELGQVAQKAVACHVMLAYDDLYSIRYFEERLRPYWRRNGWEAADLLKASAKEYAALVKRCAAFDEELMADLTKAGGAKYAALCALAYRQTIAGNKLAADANGLPLLFPKENFSNGCISTVDVLYPQAPFFLTLSPALTKAMLVPVLDYAASPKWPHGYAPHDLGTYPLATGQVYGMGGGDGDGDRMPLEESGNMLIMMAALAKADGNAGFAKRYWPLLTKWADYCVKEGLDPQNQLCSADMFGHMPRASNLALKAIIGIGGYAQLCETLGKHEEAKKYRAIACDYVVKWQALSKGDGHTLLAYGQPGTWAMKHNLIWDRILGTKLFADEVGDAEIAWYLKVQNKFGLPVDNRTDTSLIDWALWSIAPARNPADFQALFEPVFRYANETASRVPLCDWYVTTTGQQKAFQARSVVGGIFVKLLAEPSSWKRWSGQAEKMSGEWAPFMGTVSSPSTERVPAVNPLFDFPVRDTSVCLGPDGIYYLTGTTGHPTWWKTNEGIRLWKSKDLKTWEPLGLVWSFEKDATWQKDKDGNRAIWAPELHSFKGTFYIAYCVNYGGTGILRSKTGRAEGPYEDVKPDGPLTGEIDASLFADDDGKVYFLWQNGKIARLKDDLTGLAEEPRLLKPANGPHVGFEAAFLTKINGRYHLIGAEFNVRQGTKAYDCMAASSDSLYGPYGERYLAIPCAGHNVLFKDKKGKWWSTFFGNDVLAPFKEKPAILEVTVGEGNRLRPLSE